MERADVVVVGGGVMGTATALALGRRGVQTLLLEQFEIGHARGSSHGPTRIFRLSYPHPDYVRLAVRARETWRALEEEAGETLLVPSGGLDVGPTAAECAEALAACGVAHEWLSPREAERRFPAISFDGLDPILFQPDAAVCRADRTVAAQRAAALARGVSVREGVEVTAIRPAGDGVEVVAGEEPVRARVAVVTAGPWAGGLLERAGLPALPLTAVLQAVSYFAGPGGSGPPAVPTFIEWGGPDLAWYALPPAGVAPGVKLGEHVGGIPVDPAHGPFAVDPARPASLAAYVARRFPGLDPTPLAPETCLYTMTPDEDFVLDRRGPIVVGAGFSGHGFKFGPLAGEILADLATGSDARLPTGRFDLDRPGLRR